MACCPRMVGALVCVQMYICVCMLLIYVCVLLLTLVSEHFECKLVIKVLVGQRKAHGNRALCRSCTFARSSLFRTVRQFHSKFEFHFVAPDFHFARHLAFHSATQIVPRTGRVGVGLRHSRNTGIRVFRQAC